MTVDVVKPFRRLAEQLEEASLLLSINLRSVASIPAQANLFDAVNKYDEFIHLDRTEEERARLEQQAAWWDRVIEFSNAQRELGFPAVHAQTVVVEWANFEAAFEDFVVLWLQYHPNALRSSRLPRINGSLIQYELMSIEERMRHLYRELELAVGFSKHPGIAGYEEMLKLFDLPGIIEDADRRNLIEMASVRNAIMHCASIADKRVVSTCPWMGLSVGDPIRVSRADYLRYNQSLLNYAATLISRITAYEKQHPIPHTS